MFATEQLASDQVNVIRGMFAGRYRFRSLEEAAALINESATITRERLEAAGAVFAYTGRETGRTYYKLATAGQVPASAAAALNDDDDSDL